MFSKNTVKNSITFKQQKNYVRNIILKNVTIAPQVMKYFRKMQ